MSSRRSERKEREPFTKGTAIAEFELDDLIGQGGYGDIYVVHEKNEENTKYAMKVEMLDNEKHGLAEETTILKKIQGSACFPELISSGQTDRLQYLVMSLYGLSVSNTRRLLPERKMSIGTLGRLGLYMLSCIEDLHKHGFIHRDIKPGNFLFKSDPMQPLVLIDFGLSKDYIDRATGQPLPEKEKSGFRGTSKYASLNAHFYKDQSQRDDLTSWMYSLVELFNGKLIWTKAKDNAETRQLKQQTSNKDLFAGMPEGFEKMWNYINHLQFAETPKYDLLREMLTHILIENGTKFNDPFDWESLPEEKLNKECKYVKLPKGSDIKVNYLESRNAEEINEELAEKSKCACCRI